MLTDATFSIGKTHTVCQDYARAGETKGRHYAIVSDGCSSSPDTDFGSRFLTLAAIQGIGILGDNFAENGLWAIWRADTFVQNELVTHRCLDATLLAVFERENGLLQAVAWGDGVIFGVRHNGDVVAYEIDMQGVPGYPSYMLDPNRLAVYLREGYGKRTVRRWVGDKLTNIDETAWTLVRERAEPENFCFQVIFDPAEFQFIGVATDGLMSFHKMDNNQAVPLPEVLRHVCDVRVPVGQFVQRSSNFFLNKTCPKLGWRHDDDYGVAGIWLGTPSSVATSGE